MLMLGIVLLLCYGEFMWILKTVGVKKRMRGYVSWLYTGLACVLVFGSLVKRVMGVKIVQDLRNSHNNNSNGNRENRENSHNNGHGNGHGNGGR